MTSRVYNSMKMFFLVPYDLTMSWISKSFDDVWNSQWFVDKCDLWCVSGRAVAPTVNLSGV